MKRLSGPPMHRQAKQQAWSVVMPADAVATHSQSCGTARTAGRLAPLMASCELVAVLAALSPKPESEKWTSAGSACIRKHAGVNDQRYLQDVGVASAMSTSNPNRHLLFGSLCADRENGCINGRACATNLETYPGTRVDRPPNHFD